LGRKRLTIDGVKSRLADINPNIEILDDVYINNSTKLTCRCLIDGHEWCVGWSSLQQSKGCPKCGKKSMSDKLRFTIDEVKHVVANTNQNIKILSKEYTGAHSKLKCKCLIDGYEWCTSFSNLKQGKGCPKCALNTSANKRRFTLSDVITKLKDINNNIEILEDVYVDANTKLKCRCLVDGCSYEWSTSWHTLQSGHGCHGCAKNTPITISYVKNKIKEINQNILILSNEYVNARTKLKLKCLVDGYEWSATWNSLQNGHGCPICAKVAYVNNSGYNITLAERNKVEWVNKKTNVYLIKCYNENETFYKIGIAKNVKVRFSGNCMPYEYTVLKEIKTNLYDAIYLEKKLHSLNKEFSYIPQIKFDGYTECFSQLHSFDIDEYV
jgi:hypothetical protein